MFIDVVDKETTKKLDTRMKRKHTLCASTQGASFVTASVSQDSLQDSEGSQVEDDSFVGDDVDDLCSDDERVKDQNRLQSHSTITDMTIRTSCLR